MFTEQAAIIEFVRMLYNTDANPKQKQTNSSLTPNLLVLTDSHLKFDSFQMSPAWGHCHALVARTLTKGILREEPKLMEGGTNKDSPW